METERKFLLNYLPGGEKAHKGVSVRQGYLAWGNGRECRIRRMGKECFLTVKNGSGLQREEYEIPLERKQFKALWPATGKNRLEKKRFRIPLDGLTAEADLYEGKLAGLQTVEVEFPDEDSARRFRPPGWFGPELTDNKTFSNRFLAALSEEEIRKELGPLLSGPQRVYGAMPYMTINGSRHFVLVTTRGGSRWIFPKGSPEPNRIPEEIALMEADEESGIAGSVTGGPVPVYFWKELNCVRVDYYAVRVNLLKTEWKESEQRERRICQAGEALALLDDPSFEEAFRTLFPGDIQKN